jgi:hypothetical protein
VRAYAAGSNITEELVPRYLEEVHLGFKPCAPEIAVAFQFVMQMSADSGLPGEASVRSVFNSVPLVVPLLMEMNWTLEVDRKRLLITSDMPFVLWRTPTFRDRFEGIGVQTAEELRFPLDPGLQLVLLNADGPRLPASRLYARASPTRTWPARATDS